MKEKSFIHKKISFIFLLILISITPIFANERFNLAPSVIYEKIIKEKLIYHLTTIDRDPLVQIETIVTFDKLSNILKEKNYDLMINANFFDTKTKEPVGLVIKNGELLHLPIKRGVFGLTFDNQPIIDLFDITLKINIEGTIIPVNALNSPRGIDNIVIFTKYYGKETQIRENASAGIDIEVLLENKIPSMGKTYGIISNIYYGVKKTTIKDNTCIISLGGTALKYLPYFSIGKKIEIIVDCYPSIPLKEAVSGGPILIKNKEVVLGKTNELPFDNSIINLRHPRTIVGIKNNTIYLLVIEGRKEASQGVTLQEACELLKELGIEEALNLDGGGSSQKFIWGKLQNQDIERPVPVGIGIINLYPYTQPKYLSFKQKDDIYLKKGEKIKLDLLLQDENFHSYTFSTKDLTWTSSNNNIYFNLDYMTLEGKDIGESTLTITLQDLSTSKKIYVWDYTTIEILVEKTQLYIGEIIAPQIYAIDNFNRKTPLSMENLKFNPNFFKKDGSKLIAICAGKTNLEYYFNNLYYMVPIEILENTYEDFEKDKNWNIRGKNYNIENTYYTLTSQAYSGNSAILLNYASEKDNTFIYLDLNIEVPQNTKSLSLALKGQGEGWIRLLFYDSNNSPWVIDLTNTSKFTFYDWNIITKDLKELKSLSNSSNNSIPKYPLKLVSIYIVGLNPNGIKGTLLIDSIRFY